MKSLVFLIFSVVLGTACLLRASVNPDLSKFAGEVFKGGKVFDESEISDVSAHEDWSSYHRTILEVQMLASVEDPNRYQRAIDIASTYIASGKVDWVRDYLKMQRGFLYMLKGDRETGITDLEDLVNQHAFNGIQEINDPILETMRIRQKNLSTYFNDVMRQSIGHHYLDFRKDGMLPEKAFQYFDGIKAATLREKCMEQLKERLGDGSEAIIKGFENDFNESKQHEPATKARDGQPRRESTRGKKRAVDNDVPTSSEIAQSNRGVSVLHWFMLFLAAVVAIGAFFVFRSKR